MPLGVIFRGILPFLAVEIVTLLVLLCVPRITLWQPGLMLR